METTAARIRWFVDTNVLVYATDARSPFHHMARDMLKSARDKGVELCVNAQVIREYISAASRSVGESKPIPWSTILENCSRFQQMFTVLSEGQETVSRLRELLNTVPAAGKQVHDANIVATMLVYGVSVLLTHNAADFARYARFIDLLSACAV